MLRTNHRVAVYMDGHMESDYAKMGIGVLRYLPNEIVCVIDQVHAGKQTSSVLNINREVPIVETLEDALRQGADVLILGIAPSGGKIPESWVSVIELAIDLGMSIVNGLHDLLNTRFSARIKEPSKQWIWDVRIPQFTPKIATAKAMSLQNKRILLVGTDMAVGKMTAGLEILEWAKTEGIDIRFVATGQIGITIMGTGIPLDAFKVDHACGAVETAVMEAADSDWILIEGQGSLLHPGSTATLPLMRGSCPTHLILCHHAGKETLRSPEHIKIPDLKAFIALNEAIATACGTFPRAKVVGIAVNTSSLKADEAKAYIESVEAQTQIPVTDPVRFGAAKLGQAIAND